MFFLSNFIYYLRHTHYRKYQYATKYITRSFTIHAILVVHTTVYNLHLSHLFFCAIEVNDKENKEISRKTKVFKIDMLVFFLVS